MSSIVNRIKSFLFANHSLRQTIAKNAFWLSFGELVGRLLRVGIVIYAARILGAAGWGTFSYAITFTALFTILSDIGLSSVLTREAAKDPQNRSKYFSTIFIIKLFLMTAFFLVTIFMVPYVSRIELSRPLLFFVALSLVFDSLRNFGNALFRATEKMEREALINIVTQAGILIFGFALLLKSPSPENLALAYAIGSAGGLIVAFLFLIPYLKEIFSHFDKTLLKPIVAAAWPFGLTGVLGAVMISTDTIMLGWFKNAEVVGYYSAAQKPILLLYIIPSLLAGAFFPALARFAHSDNEKFRSLLEKSLSFVFLLAFPFSIGLFLISPELINLIYGAAYQPATLTLKILSATILTAYSASLIANSIFAYNRQKILIGYAAIGALGNVFFNALFIPFWGMAGAAVATLITQFLSNGYIWQKMKNINNFSVFKHLKKIAIATLIMAAGVLFLNFLKMPVLITIPIASLIYFLALMLLKEKIIFQLKSLLGGNTQQL